MEKVIIECGKCKGSGRYYLNNGMIGHCYQCDGTGIVERREHQRWHIFIQMSEQQPITPWIRVVATNKAEAKRKAKKIAMRGCYKNYVDTIAVEEDGIEYSYHRA